MNNYNPLFNTTNMARSISPFPTAGSSVINGITQVSKNRGLFSRIGGSKISLSGILNGAQKTIGTVNQIVPLYNQVKPMFQNSKILLNVAKGLRNNNNSNSRLFRNNRRNYQQQSTIDIKTDDTQQSIKKEEKLTGSSPSKPFFA